MLCVMSKEKRLLEAVWCDMGPDDVSQRKQMQNFRQKCMHANVVRCTTIMPLVQILRWAHAHKIEMLTN